MLRRAAALTFAAVLAAVAPAVARVPLSARAFDCYTLGRTLFYAEVARPATPYGVEEYLAGQRVRWSFLDGTWMEGAWYAKDGLICFEYDDLDSPQCWTFFLEDDRLTGEIETLSEDGVRRTQLVEISGTGKPRACAMPPIS